MRWCWQIAWAINWATMIRMFLSSFSRANNMLWNQGWSSSPIYYYKELICHLPHSRSSALHAWHYFWEPQAAKLHLPLYKITSIWNLKSCRIILAMHYLPQGRCYSDSDDEKIPVSYSISWLTKGRCMLVEVQLPKTLLYVSFEHFWLTGMLQGRACQACELDFNTGSFESATSCCKGIIFQKWLKSCTW